MLRKVKDMNGLKSVVRQGLGRYLELKQTQFSSNGQMFQCPNRVFHSNNDINFSCGFFPDDTRFKCHACLEKGDIFDAARLLEDKPKDGPTWVQDTLLYLAELLKVQIEYEDLSPEEARRNKIYEVLKAAAELAHLGLRKSETTMEYVRARGWDSVAGEFLLGYCSYEKLIEALSKRGYESELLVDAGLVSEKLLNRRLLFPIKDVYGRVVGFASRTLLNRVEAEKQGVESYINSSYTPVYKKSDVLYNLNQIKNNENSVILVEGFADVVTLWKKGIKNVVGLCGVNFTDEHIKALLRKGVKDIELCLDNDASGQAGEEVIMRRVKSSDGISLYLKVRDDCKDADECLNKHDFLLTSGRRSMFEHYLEKFKESKDKAHRDRALRAILLERDRIDQEQMCKRMAKELDVRLEVITEAFDDIIAREGDTTLIVEADMIKEKSLLGQSLLRFEQQAKMRGLRLGLSCGYPIFTDVMDGLQNQVYLFAGYQGTGKSAFVRNLAMNILESNPEKASILCLSLDESEDGVIARLLAMRCGLEINSMLNPKYRIELNEAYTEEERARLKAKYDDALKYLHSLSNSFAIKDETSIRDITDVERYISMYKQIAGEKQLVVIIDSLHRIRVPQKFSNNRREDSIQISDAIKRWRNIYNVPILATVELRRPERDSNKLPTIDDIKESSDFGYDADVVGVMYNELNTRGVETAKLKVINQASGEWMPIVEINFGAKNRTSSFRGRLYYDFYDSFHTLVECSKEKMQMYHSIAHPIKDAVTVS